MTETERIQELRTVLHQHNYNYYVLNQPTISDQDFDMMMHELQELESKEFETIVHKRPMLSLANTYNKEEVEDFYNRVKEGLHGAPFQICCELKFDGLSISLHYEHGQLTKAVTRGDGIQGDDVTENVRTIHSIPMQLDNGLDYPDEF